MRNLRTPDWGWKQEGRDLMKAIAAGSLFGLPILLTMEIWHLGLSLSSAQLLSFLGISLVLNFVASLAWGIRKDTSLFGAFADSMTAVGVSLALCCLILGLINQLHLTDNLKGSIGRIILATTVVSIGITFVSARFQEALEENENNQDIDSKNNEKKSKEDLHKLQLKDDLKDVGGSIGGAIVFAFSMAPTEEILAIASGLSAKRLLLLFVCEFLLCYIILFASGLWKRTVYQKDSIFQTPLVETTLSFAVGIAVSACLIGLVGFEGTLMNLNTFIASTVILALPAVVGSAGGKIAI